MTYSDDDEPLFIKPMCITYQDKPCLLSFDCADLNSHTISNRIIDYFASIDYNYIMPDCNKYDYVFCRNSETVSCYLYKNPYYKSLIPDIQKDIIEDLEKISFSITKEIEIIESDLKKIGSKDSEKELKNLKKDCLSLIYEIDERKKEIDSLSKFI